MSDDEDDFISYGSKLKDLVEGENIRKRPISVEEQTVKDNSGKRRFHGAFTGGFSAGFFNTVDTPQGWAPSQFKSSRESRSNVGTTQKPEDFMDDDDFGDFGFAPHALKTTSNFQSVKSVTRDPVTQRDLVAPTLKHLIQPAPSTIGETLLRKQGWKPGQGIGPKAVKKAKKDRLESYVKTYIDERGCSMEDEDPFMKKYKDFLFAPDELPVFVAKPKENLFGIGYQGLARHERRQDESAFNLKSGVDKKKFSITGEAFGVGAYEEDDDDVYSRNDMSQYDFSLDVSDGGRRKESSSSKTISKSLTDLTQLLDGFVLSTKKSQLLKTFPPPVIPRNWRPRENPCQRKSRFEEVSREVPVKTTNPTVDQRRSMLFPVRNEETPKEEVTVKEEPPETEEEPPQFLSDPNAKSSSHSSFKPFQANPEKQKRYEQFLVCIENNRRDALKILQPKTMTEWERERERVEFERAAHLYKPMRVSMASRFVSAGTSKEDDSTGSSGGAGQEKRKAVELKMFGKLTRDTSDWIPARILCVRFNVQNPYGENKEPTTRKKNNFGSNQLFSILSDENNSQNTKQPADESPVETLSVKAEPSESTPVEMKLVKDEEAISTERPPMDLFKAIFANSDSESSSDEDQEQTGGEEDDQSRGRKSGSNSDSMDIKETTSESEKRRTNLNSSGRISLNNAPRQGQVANGGSASGIFAGIDFDKFIKRRRKTPPPVVRERIAPNRPKSILDQSVRTILGIKSGDTSDGEYGPMLPPPIASAKKIVISSDTESDEWEEKKKSKKKKHKKEKKKKKKKSKKKDH